MTKAKLNELVLEACAKHNASAELTAALNELTSPKSGGASSNVEDYTVFNPDGSVAFILCSTLKVWLPVENFKPDESSKNGFKRESIPGLKAWTERQRAFKASEKAILNDVLDGVLTGPEGKSAIDELKASQPELTIPEGIEAFVERPTV
ncbi:MAG: hypothetical protein JHC33_11090 [Ignisphaera sp.]|nr:hypothetical protein [Ignisphaera sp.]